MLFNEHAETPTVIRRGSKIISISCSFFKLQDTALLLPPGCSYSDFLRTFEVEEGKLHFPYDAFVGNPTAFLDQSEFVPRSAFYSSIRRRITVSETEYADARALFYGECAGSWRRYLAVYNYRGLFLCLFVCATDA